MTNDEWETIAKQRLIDSGFAFVFRSKKGGFPHNILRDNEYIIDYSWSSTTENSQTYVGINLRNITEAEFILKYL